MNKLNEILRSEREKVLLGVYFLIMVAVVGPLFLTLGEAWRQSAIVRPAILSLNPVISVNLEQFSALMFGVYLGFLLLLILDPKKRVQGFLLTIGTVSALIGLLSIGLFIPNINFAENILLLLLGMGSGTVMGGGRQLLEVRTTRALEFRRAAVLMFYLLTSIIVVGLAELHLNIPQFFEVTSNEIVLQSVTPSISINRSGILMNAAMGGIFILTLQRFVEYDSSESFFILGPPASGKSLFLVGKYLAALDDATTRDADTPLPPSSDLMQLVDDLDAADQDAGWGLDPTGATDVEELEFQFIKGRVFPKNIQLASLDYAGEYLDELPNALASSPDEIDNSTLRLLTQKVSNADTLIMLIDVERYNNNESLQIDPYFDILNAVSGKDIIFVATKCDILADEFRNERALEPHQYFDEFREFVNETLVENNQSVRALVQNTSESEINPVYYKTNVDDRGERVPLRDRNGNVITVGFEELLEKMG